MEAPKYEVVFDIDYSALSDLFRKLGEEDTYKTYTSRAVKSAGDYLAQQWIEEAKGNFKHTQGGYVQGIVDGRDYPYQDDPLRYRIENKAEHAVYLEYGFESFDLKKMLQTSQKVRYTKDGKRYLVIPFRHGNPKSVSLRAMPKEVYADAKNLRQSVTTKIYKEGVQQGAKDFEEAQFLRKYNSKKVKRRSYKWGDQLEGFEGTVYEGMYRFNANVEQTRLETDKFGSGSIKNDQDYSIYMTFRIMLEGSSGWIHPGLRPMYILKNTVEKHQNMITELIADGVRKDLEMFGFK